jgi:hypothetical protein
VETDWLSRLERSGRFAQLAHEEERAQPLPLLGGLCGAMVPEAVRSNHGWEPLLPTDRPAVPRPARRGEFFRCE